ncbi:unnamed protein product [Linum trigynum]|uniref:Uncharacterized protein n=1 Tax=Linum trigynum TaxID=586398 RepID=A0AAV2GTF5_9ROSI
MLLLLFVPLMNHPRINLIQPLVVDVDPPSLWALGLHKNPRRQLPYDPLSLHLCRTLSLMPTVAMFLDPPPPLHLQVPLSSNARLLHQC